MPGDEIRLVLPAEPTYGHIARIAVTRLALQCRLSRPHVEDLRIAVDETLIFLLRSKNNPDRGGIGKPTSITLVFTMGPDRLIIDVTAEASVAESTPNGQRPVDEDARNRLHEIVGEMVDAVTISDDGHNVRLEMARPD